MSSWLVSKGAAESTLQTLQAQYSRLPSDYLDLLRKGNGGEVGLRSSPFNLCLDSAEDALAYRATNFSPVGFFVFGGNGGGALLAFDLRSPDRSPVVSYDPIDPEGSMKVVAADFDGLMASVEEG